MMTLSPHCSRNVGAKLKLKRPNNTAMKLKNRVQNQAHPFNVHNPQKRISPMIPIISGSSANIISRGISVSVTARANAPTPIATREDISCRSAIIITPVGF